MTGLGKRLDRGKAKSEVRQGELSRKPLDFLFVGTDLWRWGTFGGRKTRFRDTWSEKC